MRLDLSHPEATVEALLDLRFMTSQPPSPQTSHTHPIRVAEIPYPGSAGLIGLCHCPGQKQRDTVYDWWERDLDMDLDAIECWRPFLVISLLQSHELERLEVPHLGAQVLARDIRWIHLPILDRQAPGRSWDAVWRALAPKLHEELFRGRRVLLHCTTGLGRTGTIAARLLIEAGMDADAAMALIRAARPGAIETVEQESYLERCALAPLNCL